MDKQESYEDIISNLPDGVIHGILSLVPTKYVIRSSSVSKRWEKLSHEHVEYANNLDFGEDFARDQSPDQFADNLNKITSFNRSKKIDTFKLVFIPGIEMYDSIDPLCWIQYATARQVKDIELDFCNQPFELPIFLFDCRSLVSVKLINFSGALQLPEKYAGFGNLQALHLKQVKVTDNVLERLLANCKLLKVLVLKNCETLRSVRILNSVRLQTLTIHECSNVSAFDISGPKIRSLLISTGQFHFSSKLGKMPMLEELFIGTSGGAFGGVLLMFKNMIPSFAHARRLTLYLGRLVPSLFSGLQVRFNKLQELHLINSPQFGLFSTDVYCFFKHFACPSLKKISIQLCFAEGDMIWEHRHPDMEPIKCVFNNLKEVTLRNFSRSTADRELATFFMQSSPILETLLLVTSHKTDVPTSIFAGNAIPKASSIAQVRVSKLIANDSLLSLLNCHHVSDCYQGSVL